MCGAAERHNTEFPNQERTADTRPPEIRSDVEHSSERCADSGPRIQARPAPGLADAKSCLSARQHRSSRPDTRSRAKRRTPDGWQTAPQSGTKKKIPLVRREGKACH